jgi:hypothetical protein
VLAAILLCAFPGSMRSARAAEDSAPPAAPRSAARADSATRHHPRPFFVMLRSAAVPGLGQATNHAWLKAVAVAAGEGYLGYRAWRAWRAELDAVDRANAAAALADQARLNSDPAGEAAYEAAYDRYLADQDRHYNSKIDFIWWTAAAHLLQMADAYVDAHFVDFDAEFAPDDPHAAARGPRITLALRARF